jgi:hypothetical protein
MTSRSDCTGRLETRNGPTREGKSSIFAYGPSLSRTFLCNAETKSSENQSVQLHAV